MENEEKEIEDLLEYDEDAMINLMFDEDAQTDDDMYNDD